MAESLVCQSCWSGLFSFDSWQTVLAAKQQPRQWGYSKGYCYTTTWEAMHAPASSGCNWCQLLKHTKHAGGEVEIWVAYDEKGHCTPAGTKMLKVKLAGGGAFSSSNYHMYTDADDKAAKFVGARDRVLDIAAPSSYRLALECLDSCARLHERCAKPTATMLPDRVINYSTPDNPKLVLTGGATEGLYVALSYVWGAPQPTTKLENINEFVARGLNMSEFPTTIREAVSVTHNLGLSYLWIDALCIIQDSNEDKVRQLSMMGQIYRSSYVTIIAACGTSVNEGFLHKPRPKKVPDARIPYQCPDGTVGSVLVASSLDFLPGDCSRSYYDDLEPVNHRGWCLQERILPPRCFIYASHTLQYDCQTETVNIGQALCESSTLLKLPNITLPASPSDLETARQAWMSTLWDYSSRNLTVSADKLVAVAGVAEYFQPVFGGRYLAGLWEMFLLTDLLWRKLKGEPLPKTRSAEYLAPSWSWASIDGRVQLPRLERGGSGKADDVVECEVLECQVTLVNKDLLFGQVMSGLLTLNGFLEEATVASGKVFVASDLGKEPVDVGWANMDATEERGRSFAIPLIWDRGGAFVEGLIVYEVDGGRFRRIGHFSNNSASKDVRWIERLSKRVVEVV